MLRFLVFASLLWFCCAFSLLTKQVRRVADDVAGGAFQSHVGQACLRSHHRTSPLCATQWLGSTETVNDIRGGNGPEGGRCKRLIKAQAWAIGAIPIAFVHARSTASCGVHGRALVSMCNELGQSR